MEDNFGATKSTITLTSIISCKNQATQLYKKMSTSNARHKPKNAPLIEEISDEEELQVTKEVPTPKISNPVSIRSRLIGKMTRERLISHSRISDGEYWQLIPTKVSIPKVRK